MYTIPARRSITPDITNSTTWKVENPPYLLSKTAPAKNSNTRAKIKPFFKLLMAHLLKRNYFHIVGCGWIQFALKKQADCECALPDRKKTGSF
jgi:hypothetical protein